MKFSALITKQANTRSIYVRYISCSYRWRKSCILNTKHIVVNLVRFYIFTFGNQHLWSRRAVQFFAKHMGSTTRVTQRRLTSFYLQLQLLRRLFRFVAWLSYSLVVVILSP